MARRNITTSWVFLVKEDKKKRHISASREARIIPTIALERPVTAIFVYKKIENNVLKGFRPAVFGGVKVLKLSIDVD